MKAFFGLCTAALGAGGVLQDGFQGMAIAGTLGAFVGLGLRLLVTGALGLAGRRMSNKSSWGLALAVTVACALVGPTVSASNRRGMEATDWAKVKDSKQLAAWNKYTADYHGDAARFRNPEWEARMTLAHATEARAAGNAGALREDLGKAAEHSADPLWQKVSEESQAGLTALFSKGLTSLARKGANVKLQKAFAQVVEDLSQHPDGKLYLVFTTKAKMKPPKGDAEAVADMRSAPQVKAVFPKGDAPVFEEGEAFSPAYDEKRRKTLEKVLRESFGAVFPAGLMEIAPLPPKAERKGKPILQIENVVERMPDYFYRTREGKVIGLMFGLEVQWEFTLFDRDGKELYSGTTVSQPATEVRFSVSPSDPDWAPYGILVDSAYYNFGRTLTGAFGLKPPPVKQVFTLEE